MCIQIYALKPFEADIGYVSPVETSALSSMAAGSGRGTNDDVIIAPADVTFANSDTRLWTATVRRRSEADALE